MILVFVKRGNFSLLRGLHSNYGLGQTESVCLLRLTAREIYSVSISILGLFEFVSTGLVFSLFPMKGRKKVYGHCCLSYSLLFRPWTKCWYCVHDQRNVKYPTTWNRSEGKKRQLSTGRRTYFLIALISRLERILAGFFKGCGRGGAIGAYVKPRPRTPYIIRHA